MRRPITFAFLVGLALFVAGGIRLPYVGPSMPAAAGGGEVAVEFYFQAGCSHCIHAEQVLDAWLEGHPDLNVSRVQVEWGVNHTLYWARLDALGLPHENTPSVAFIKGDCALILAYDTILEPDGLESNYKLILGWDDSCGGGGGQQEEINPWLSFLSGLLTGVSPCLVLIMAVIIPTLSMQVLPKKKLVRIFVGLTLGILTMYLLLSLAILGAFDLFAQLVAIVWVKWLFGGLLLGLGLWYLVDAFAENSRLFQTPEPIKQFVVKMIQKGGFFYGWAMGFIFSFLKVPCVGGIMVALLLGAAEHPVFFSLNLLLFYIGLILPLIVLMAALLRGVDSERVSAWRKKYRPWIRIVSGAVIIGLTLYSLFLVG